MQNKSEQLLQQSINSYCNIKHIPFYCINNNVVPPVVNGVYNREFAIRQAVKNKRMGLKKGAADGFIIIHNKTIFIEFKTNNKNTSKQTSEQKEFENICKANKQNYFIVRSLEDFEEILGHSRLSPACPSALLYGTEIKGQDNDNRKTIIS